MKTKNLPLYITIADELIYKIEQEEFKKGETLPTEAKLCKIYAVSRVTIRQAINLLVQKEYIKKIQGSGSHVIFSRKTTILNRSSKIISFSDEMRMLKHTPSAKVITFQMIIADKTLRDELNINEGDSLYFYERILMGDEYPYCLEQGYLPTNKFLDFNITHLKNSKLRYIEKEKHIDIAYSHQIVHAILSNEHLSKILNIDEHKPLLNMTHITYDNNGEPIEKTSIICDSTVYPAHFIKMREID